MIDFALWGGLVPGNLPDLAALAERGVIGLKSFMSSSGIDDFEAADDTTLWEGMREAARLDLIVAVHAENDRITGDLARRAIAAGRTGVRDYLASRPVVAELEAIARAITFAEASGCALHVVHVSSGAGVALVVEARARGVDVTCETCPHYLVLTEDDVERLGAVAKCAPPLRSQHELDALWNHIGAGTLTMVTSDHSPAPASMKQGDDFFAIWGGISGCQSTLPLMLTAGNARRGIALDVITRCTATSAAERFRLPLKGRLVAGADADLALVDLQGQAVLREHDLLYRHKHSPYLGMHLTGQVRRTILRGQTVMLNGQACGTPRGQFVRPVMRAMA
jgi:allantoinase